MIHATLINATHVQLSGDLEGVRAWLSFESPGAKFHPAYRARDGDGNRKWDGKIRLIDSYGKMRVGLLPRVKEWCEKNDESFFTDEETSLSFANRQDVLNLFDLIKLPEKFERR